MDRKALRSKARDALKNAHPHPALVTLCIAAILAVLMFLAFYLSGSFSAYGTIFVSVLRGETEVTLPASSDSGFVSILVFALEMMAGALSLGYTLYCMRIARGQEAGVGDVFDIFGQFLRAVLLNLLRSLILMALSFGIMIMLSLLVSVVLLFTMPGATPEEMITGIMNSPWISLLSLLFFLPYLVVSYFYRLADFILLDNPQLTCLQVLSMSRLAMRGRKGQLFLLDLSFAGWYVLSLIPGAALFVQPYITVTRVNFYQEVMPPFMEKFTAAWNTRTPFSSGAPTYTEPKDHPWTEPGKPADPPDDPDRPDDPE